MARTDIHLDQTRALEAVEQHLKARQRQARGGVTAPVGVRRGQHAARATRQVPRVSDPISATPVRLTPARPEPAEPRVPHPQPPPRPRPQRPTPPPWPPLPPTSARLLCGAEACRARWAPFWQIRSMAQARPGVEGTGRGPCG